MIYLYIVIQTFDDHHPVKTKFKQSVTIQMKAVRQCLPVELFGLQYTLKSNFGLLPSKES